jgi:hypothetical protein
MYGPPRPVTGIACLILSVLVADKTVDSLFLSPLCMKYNAM